MESSWTQRNCAGRFVLANAFKEGDLLVGGTRDDRVREEARRALLATPLGEIRRTTLVEDRVSDALSRALNGNLQSELDRLTVGQLRQRLLGTPEQVPHFRDGLTSEAIAAVVKVMTERRALLRRASVVQSTAG